MSVTLFHNAYKAVVSWEILRLISLECKSLRKKQFLANSSPRELYLFIAIYARKNE